MKEASESDIEPGARRRRSRTELLAPVGAYLLLALAVTYPFVIHPTSTLLAPIGGDVTFSVAKFQTLANERANPFVSNTLASVGYPEGAQTRPGVDRVSFLSTLVLWLGSLGMGAVAAHGLYALLGYILTASTTFLFVRRITSSVAAGFIAGLAYGFWPHLYLTIRAASTYAHMWLLILPLWAFWILGTNPRPRHAMVAGLSILPAMFWTPYYALHALVIGTSCLLVLIIREIWLRRATWRSLILLLLVLCPWLTGLGMYWFLGSLTSFAEVPARTLAEAYEQSAHPLMFVVPGYSSIWGEAPYSALVRVVPRANWANLYVGLSVLGLAAIGVFAALRRKVTGQAPRSPERVGGLLCIATVAASFLCSLPPTVRFVSVRIPTPNALIVAAVPAFRAGQRFVMPLMAGLTVLAGLGADQILQRIARRWLLLATAIIGMVVTVDLWARPPESISLLPDYPALAALRSLPARPALHYPQLLFDSKPCLLQTQHRKVLVNHCEIAPASHRLTRLSRMSPCEALEQFRADGVGYVIVERSHPEVLQCFQRNAVGRHRGVAQDRYLIVFEFL